MLALGSGSELPSHTTGLGCVSLVVVCARVSRPFSRKKRLTKLVVVGLVMMMMMMEVALAT